MSRRKNKENLTVQCKLGDLRNIYKLFAPDGGGAGAGFAALVCGLIKAPMQSDDQRIRSAYDLGWKMRVSAEQKADIAKLRSEITSNRRWFIREMIAAKHDYACAKCGSTDGITIDHIRPISCGGGNDLENLQFLCRRCNSKKGAR